MIYINILLILIFFSFIHEKKNKYHFVFLVVLYFFFLALRYGQGTDYFNYKTLYLLNPKEYKFFFQNSYLNNTEPFFFLINIFAKNSGLTFQFVIIVCALITVFVSATFILKYSRYKLFSLFILFSNYFFYFQSALRQSIAMVIIAYAIYEYIQKRKIKTYIFSVVLAMMFHTTSIVGFIVPVVLGIKLKKIYNYSYFLLFSVFLLLCSHLISRLIIFFVSFIPRYSTYKNYVSINVGAVVVRLILSFLVLYILRKNNVSDFSRKISKLYLVGNLMFFALSSISILSRLTDYFAFLEVILFPNIVTKPNKKNIKLSFCLLISLFSALFIKDIGAALKQDHYYNKNIFSYPYITIFNKERVLSEKKITQVLYERLITED
ncbi:MAG: EpsG family protein [Treponema sp.]|nr:EpsG family protein [Treponema sp.]